MSSPTTHSGLAPSRWLAAGGVALAGVFVVYMVLGGWYVYARSTSVAEILDRRLADDAALVADLEAAHPDIASLRVREATSINAWNALWIDNLSRIVTNALEAQARTLRTEAAPPAPDPSTKSQLEKDAKPTTPPARGALLARDAALAQPGLLSKLFGPEQFFSYVLAVWAALILAGEAREVSRQRAVIARLGPIFPDGMRIRPDAIGSLVARLRSGQDSVSLTGELTYRALQRFERTRDIAASDAVVRADADAAASEFNSRLSIVRFVVWAIPSIGFIGTVRGIGSALGNASDSAKLPEVVSYLGVAFDTTFVALLLSILLVLLSHELERRTDGLLEDVQGFCLGRVVRRFDAVASGTKDAVGAKE